MLTQSNTKRSGIHTPTLCFHRQVELQDCTPQFFHSYLFDIWQQESGYLKKVIAFPSPHLLTVNTLQYVSPLHKYSSSHHLDREGMHQDAVSLLAGIQHFMPGVTHQPSHHSAVKCQQSQIPQPRLRFKPLDDELCLWWWMSPQPFPYLHTVCVQCVLSAQVRLTLKDKRQKPIRSSDGAVLNFLCIFILSLKRVTLCSLYNPPFLLPSTSKC